MSNIYYQHQTAPMYFKTRFFSRTFWWLRKSTIFEALHVSTLSLNIKMSKIYYQHQKAPILCITYCTHLKVGINGKKPASDLQRGKEIAFFIDPPPNAEEQKGARNCRPGGGGGLSSFRREPFFKTKCFFTAQNSLGRNIGSYVLPTEMQNSAFL